MCRYPVNAPPTYGCRGDRTNAHVTVARRSTIDPDSLAVAVRTAAGTNGLTATGAQAVPAGTGSRATPEPQASTAEPQASTSCRKQFTRDSRA
jgi:hypothetical protein